MATMNTVNIPTTKEIVCLLHLMSWLTVHVHCDAYRQFHMGIFHVKLPTARPVMTKTTRRMVECVYSCIEHTTCRSTSFNKARATCHLHSSPVIVSQDPTSSLLCANFDKITTSRSSSTTQPASLRTVSTNLPAPAHTDFTNKLTSGRTAFTNQPNPGHTDFTNQPSPQRGDFTNQPTLGVQISQINQPLRVQFSPIDKPLSVQIPSFNKPPRHTVSTNPSVPRHTDFTKQPTPERTDLSNQQAPRRTDSNNQQAPRSRGFINQLDPRHSDFTNQPIPRRTDFTDKPAPRRTVFTTQLAPRRTDIANQQAPRSTVVTNQPASRRTDITNQPVLRLKVPMNQSASMQKVNIRHFTNKPVSRQKYYLYRGSMSWREAEKACIDVNAILINIDSPAKQATAVKEVNGSGLSYVATGAYLNMFHWCNIKGNRLGYWQWAEGRPSVFGMYAALSLKDGYKWRALKALQKVDGGLCEK